MSRNNSNEILAVSPDEAFRRLGVSRALGYKLIKEGVIIAVRLGERRLLVPVAALEKLLETDTQEDAGK